MMSAPEVLSFVQRLEGLTDGMARVSEDNLQTLQVRAVGVEVGGLLESLMQARGLDGIVQIDADSPSSTVTIEAHSDGWSVEEDPEGQAFTPLRPRYSNAEIAEKIRTGNVTITFRKDSWGAHWTGWSIHTFSSWLTSVGPHVAMLELLSAGTARIALSDWNGAPIALGPTLTIGDLACSPPPDPEIAWPEARPIAPLRMALVSARQAPSEVAPELRRASVWGGLSVLGEQVLPDGSVIFDRRTAARITLPADREVDEHTAEWVKAAIEWVMMESNQTRLTVARQVIAENSETLAVSVDARALIARLEVAYRAAIDERTSRALTALASFNSTMNDLARKIDSATEDSITRIIAAVLAILVGSVVAKDLQGWPLLAASFLVAAYPLWVAFSVLGGIRSDVARQRDTIKQAFPISRSQSGESPEFVGERYAKQIAERLRFRQGLAVFVALGIVIAGILLYEHAGD